MRKILLVIDEFTELVGLETLFRRLGFDVLSVARENAIQDAILGFPPDLVVATGAGRHVDGLTLATRVRFGPSRPKIVALVGAQIVRRSGEADEGGDARMTQEQIDASPVDAIIETPFEARTALKVVCKLLQVPHEPILEKYAKIVGARLLEPEELKIIKHPNAPQSQTQRLTTPATRVVGAADGAAVDAARADRFRRMLEAMDGEDLPPIAEVGAMKEARHQLQEAVKSADEKSQEELEAIAKEKREFVKAMARAIKERK